LLDSAYKPEKKPERINIKFWKIKNIVWEKSGKISIVRISEINTI
jgi:hypothetical protein